MNSFENYRKFTRPSLADMLEILGLQYEYNSAEGDLLYGIDSKGKPVQVYDFLGGYGSTLLGHNHPEMLKTLKKIQDEKTVFHSQASVRTKTAELSQKLNEVLHQETSEKRSFVVTVGNSGAEAVEIALKHALMEWQHKKRNFVLMLKSQFYAQKSVPSEAKSFFEKFLHTLEHCEPTVLAFRGSFHGKTAASVTVTDNGAYSSMYGKKPLSVQFIEKEMLESDVAALIEKSDFGFEWQGTKIHFSRIIGLIFEPIQGEGGIQPLSSELLQSLQTQLKNRKVPLIADEIQSGFFRTGNFLASTEMGLEPDYILLGKSLGGGIGKISAAMIASDHYQEDFGWVHTSTFAEDDWSSSLALTALEILLKKKTTLQENARQFENDIQDLGKKLKSQFPNLIKEVRGKGFLMGLEFNFSDRSLHSSFLHFVYDNGYATYLFTSYLLQRHCVRVGVTMSAPSTLRFEPSFFISQEAVAKLSEALKDLCQVLQDRKMAKLMSHLWKQEPEASTLTLVSDPATPRVHATKNIPRIGFLSHVVNVDWIRRMERAFTGVQSTELERFLNLYLRGSSPALYHEQLIEGKNGEKAILNLYGLMTSSHQFEADLRNNTKNTYYKVQEAVDMAAQDGCEYFGLGQFTSIVSQNGLLLDQSTPVTTGNSLTAGMAFRAVERVIKDRFQSRPDLKIGVVGFTGNICHVVSQLLADLNYPMTLVYREPYATSDRFKQAVQALLSSSQTTLEQLTLAHQIEAVDDCDVILVGTNSSKEFIRSEHVKSGAVILDISVPSNVHSDVRKRNDVLYFQGGFARFPFDQKLEHIWAPTYGSKNWYACMSETLMCGLLGYKEPFSLGALNKEKVLLSLRMADQVGIELGDLHRA